MVRTDYRSRAVVASGRSRTQDVGAFPMVVYLAIQQHGAPEGLVTDGGDVVRPAWVPQDQGESERAVALALAELDLFWEYRDQAATIECLVGLAAAAAALGLAEPAGRLLGATDRLREDLSIALNSAADRLDAVGRPLPMAQAVAEARALAAELMTASTTPAQAAPSGLTPRELDVLRLVAAGHSNREIAHALSISERTVENHVLHILTKLDVSSRTAAAGYAIRHGLD